MAQFTGSMTWIFTHLWWKLKRTNLLQIIIFLGTVIQTPLGTFYLWTPSSGSRNRSKRTYLFVKCKSNNVQLFIGANFYIETQAIHPNDACFLKHPKWCDSVVKNVFGARGFHFDKNAKEFGRTY